MSKLLDEVDGGYYPPPRIAVSAILRHVVKCTLELSLRGGNRSLNLTILAEIPPEAISLTVRLRGINWDWE
jgi:hypothetical protein